MMPHTFAHYMERWFTAARGHWWSFPSTSCCATKTHSTKQNSRWTS